MFKDVLRHMDMTIFAELALVLFVLVFVLIAIKAWRTPRRELDHFSNLPISDPPRQDAQEARKS